MPSPNHRQELGQQEGVQSPHQLPERPPKGRAHHDPPQRTRLRRRHGNPWATIDDVLLHAQQRQQAQATRTQKAQDAGFLTRKQRAEANRRAAEAQWQEQQERLRNIDAVKASQADRWETSDIRRLVADAHGGDIPAAITWPGGSFLIAIDASPAHWHAHIYMRHIHGQPAGAKVDAHAAITTLHNAGISTPGQRAPVIAAVDDYLHNLMQRGILARPGGDPFASGYVVVTDALRQLPTTPTAPTPPARVAEEPRQTPLL